jgi:hypothetical protein
LKSGTLKYRNQIVAFLLCLLAATSAFAAQVTGTVTNGTTNKPASGDEVVLLSLATGMDEVARTKTDAQGHYSLNLPDERTQYLVRVSRQSVHYSRQLPPGTTTADITVYDAATQLDNVTTGARVFHFQASGGSLDVSDMYVLRNESQPPRSKIGNQTFAVTLPDGAQMGEASTTGPSGMPLSVAAVPSGAKNRYAYDFPIRPGETRFEVVYKLPYSGQYEFSITPESPLSELGVLLPKSMKFSGVASNFSQDSDEAGMAVFFIKNVAANQPIKFSLSGEGVIPQEGSPEASGSSSAPSEPIRPVKPVSGLWYIIGAAVGILVGLALVVWRKSQRNKSIAAPQSAKSATKASKQQQSPPEMQPPGDMQDVLKEELFQLETDRLNGKISAEDYEKTKAGLDTLMRRQMNRK